MEILKQPRYAVRIGNRWFPDMVGDVDTTGSQESYAGVFNYPLTGLAIDGVDKYRVATERSGWLPYKTDYDLDDPAGDGSNILAVEICGNKLMYMTHIKGGSWSKARYGDESEYSGNMLPIDAIQILRI